jgi:hypothetical protein
LDAILQMASREVPPGIIAEELHLPETDVRDVMDRFYLLLTMTKAPRLGGPQGPEVVEGQLRNTIVIDEPKPRTSAPWRNDDGSWEGPLRPVPISLNEQIDAVWDCLLKMLQQKKDMHFVDLIRYLTKHDNGRYRLRSATRAKRMASLFNTVFASKSNPIAQASVLQTHKASPKQVVQINRASQKGDRWSAGALTVYLLMLACLERLTDLSPLLERSMKG